MSQKQVILEGVIIRGASLHNSDQRHARIEFIASWTEEIRREMDWDEAPDNYGAIDLFGTLLLSEAVLTPEAPVAKNGDMPQHAETFPATEIGGFNLVPLKDKGGEVTGRELRCTLKSNSLVVPGRAARFVDKLGRSPATLVCTLAEEKSEQQRNLDEVA